MKRLLFALSACLLLLSGCSNAGNDWSMDGFVIACLPDAAGYIIDTEDHGAVTVYVNERTRIYSRCSEVETEDFITGAVTDVMVHVEWDEGRSFDKDEKTVYPSFLIVEALWYRDAAQLSDGASLDILADDFMMTYYLKDGVKLLQINRTVGPEHISVSGQDSYDDLSEAAKVKVLAYYEAQGDLYDIGETLERAYADYQNKTIFSSYRLAQDISPLASNESVMYFLTTVLLPDSSIIVHEEKICAAFDRETGEYIPTMELFTCSESLLAQQLLALSNVTDEALIAEMEDAFDPEYILLAPEHIELRYPAGSLPSQEHAYLITIPYDTIGLPFLIHDWAIPNS